jgi:sugar phosphate isomerase/epimerase
MAEARVGLSVGYAAEGLADVAGALDALESLGLDSVELFLPALGVVVGGRVRPAALRALRAACSGRPFGITLHGPLSGDLGDPDHGALHRDVARAGLEAAAEIGAPVLVQHATVLRRPEPGAAERAQALEIEALAALAPEAAAAGCVLAVETLFARRDEWTASPAELAAMLRAVDHPSVGATIDFSHAALHAAGRGADCLAELAPLAPFARHMHVHDSFGRPAPFRPWSRGDAVAFGFGDLHLPPGAGSLPWDDFAALSIPAGCVANLELDARWRDEWPAAIAWTRRWAARLGAVVAARRRA